MRVRDRILSVVVTLLFAAVAVICLGSATPLCAQSTNSGTLAGVVADPSGAVVNGATVTLTDTATKTSRTPTTTRRRRTGTTTKATATPGGRSSSPSNGALNRDALLQTLFPNGIPAKENVIRSVNNWLDEAERLTRLR